MEVIEFGRLTDTFRHELEGDEPDPFESRGNPLTYRPKDRHVALRDDAGRLVASTGMVVVEVEVEGERFPVVGFGGVIVNATHRGQGLGRKVLEAALAKAGTLGPDFALLFCHANRMGLYRKVGFIEVEATVTVEQSNGSANMHQRTMWRALREGAEWPQGPVLLRSLPF
jgi:predicted N-acetyltransferase YhbS